MFVISRAAADAMATEAGVWSVRVAGWGAPPAQALSPLAEVIAVPDRAFDGAALLLSLPQGIEPRRDVRGPGQGRRLGALDGPRRQPRDPLYGCRRASNSETAK